MQIRKFKITAFPDTFKRKSERAIKPFPRCSFSCLHSLEIPKEMLLPGAFFRLFSSKLSPLSLRSLTFNLMFSVFLLFCSCHFTAFQPWRMELFFCPVGVCTSTLNILRRYLSTSLSPAIIITINIGLKLTLEIHFRFCAHCSRVHHDGGGKRWCRIITTQGSTRERNGSDEASNRLIPKYSEQILNIELLRNDVRAAFSVGSSAFSIIWLDCLWMSEGMRAYVSEWITRSDSYGESESEWHQYLIGESIRFRFLCNQYGGSLWIWNVSLGYLTIGDTKIKMILQPN